MFSSPPSSLSEEPFAVLKAHSAAYSAARLLLVFSDSFPLVSEGYRPRMHLRHHLGLLPLAVWNKEIGNELEPGLIEKDGVTVHSGCEFDRGMGQ